MSKKIQQKIQGERVHSFNLTDSKVELIASLAQLDVAINANGAPMSDEDKALFYTRKAELRREFGALAEKIAAERQPKEPANAP